MRPCGSAARPTPSAAESSPTPELRAAVAPPSSAPDLLDEVLDVRAEGVLRGQIGPRRCGTLESVGFEVDAVGGDLGVPDRRRRIVDDIGPERGEDADGLRVERLVRLLSGEGAQVDALAQVVEEREVVDPTGIEVEEHDLAQTRVEDLLRLLLDDLLGPVAELLAQLCHRFIVLADLGSPFEDELALFGHELVEPPGVTVQGGVLALGDALGVLDESAGAFGF